MVWFSSHVQKRLALPTDVQLPKSWCGRKVLRISFCGTMPWQSWTQPSPLLSHGRVRSVRWSSLQGRRLPFIATKAHNTALKFGATWDLSLLLSHFSPAKPIDGPFTNNAFLLGSLRACFPPLPEETILQLNQDDAEHARTMKGQGWFCTKAARPARKCLGPELPPADSLKAAVMLRRWSERRPPDVGAYV